MSSAYHHIGEHRSRQRIGLDFGSMRQDHSVEVLLLSVALTDCDRPESIACSAPGICCVAGRSIIRNRVLAVSQSKNFSAVPRPARGHHDRAKMPAA